MMPYDCIHWFTAAALDAFAAPPPGGPWCRVLIADLRDPRILPLLAPAPVATDYADEARPATNDRAYFLARRAAQRSLIAALGGIDATDVLIRYDADGAPRVENPAGLFVSVSGHGPYAILAIASQPCGVDFEPLHNDVSPIDDVLHPLEIRELAVMPNAAAKAQFLRIWTAKEAYLKAMGKGFLNDPQAVSVQVSGTQLDITDNEKVLQQCGQLHEVTLDGAALIAACVVIDREQASMEG